MRKSGGSGIRPEKIVVPVLTLQCSFDNSVGTRSFWSVEQPLTQSDFADNSYTLQGRALKRGAMSILVSSNFDGLFDNMIYLICKRCVSYSNCSFRLYVHARVLVIVYQFEL